MAEKNIRKRAKISAMITVIFIFVVCTTTCLYFYLTKQTRNISSHKELILRKTERQSRLLSDQLAQQKFCDSLFMRIDRYNPGINASFEENDIKGLINDLRGIYEKNSNDIRYKIFYQTAQFYDMWFADKKVVWSKRANIDNFSRNLQQREMGHLKKENELTTMINNNHD